MAKIKILWTKTAVNQRNYIFNYWNTRNKSYSYSKKLNQKIIERISILIKNPEIGKITSIANYRAISLGNYSIIYTFIESKIYIT
ncbi:type II toxin-antitoxin system RelE/ParE family toxin [uncultured Flavobacterium sp.]|uniref:type II toxin-antitoxin system RelE/ParE family toxin n=1 Tax=uncultured Flavobacterium sp. TaxID=165435 RepID=UPI0030C8B5C9